MNSSNNPDPASASASKQLFARIRTWLKICSLLLAGLILAKILGIEVFIEIEYDGEPILAALTRIETYLIPLAALLAYLLLNWLWQRVRRSQDPE